MLVYWCISTAVLTVPAAQMMEPGGDLSLDQTYSSSTALRFSFFDHTRHHTPTIVTIATKEILDLKHSIGFKVEAANSPETR
jgi:hypothetical protein